MATRILSIDGGGIRGVIPAMVLTHLEERCGKPVAELFDVVAGTSTGGILALGLTCPGAEGRPRYSAQDMVDLYAEEGETIFPSRRFAILRQLHDEKYSAEGLEEVLKRKLGDARLKDALTDVLVTSYDIGRRQPLFFRSVRAKDEPEEHDFAMRDVARATSAAPTYFEPARLPAKPPHPAYTLVDGGVFANNPAMCALVDRSTVGGGQDELTMVSLGTGVLTRSLSYEDAKHWGLIGWGRHVLDIVFDGVSDTVDYQLATLLGERYLRLQTDLDKASDDLDDASEDNVDQLKLEGEDVIKDNAAALERLCERLSG